MSVIYFLFLIFLALVFFVVAFFGSIVNFLLRAVFGIDLRGPKRSAASQSQGMWDSADSSTGTSGNGYNNVHSGNAHHEAKANARQGGKIFSSDEGEYVDFEDVRE